MSAVYLLMSICLLLSVCMHCYPQAEEKLREVIVGVSDSPVREAFGVLAEGLEESRPVKEVLSRSYEVLVGEKT